VPLPFIDEIVSIKRDELVRIGESELVHYRDTVLPLLNLNKYFNLPENTNSIFNALVIGNESDRAGLVIEKILGQREIVVRSLSDPLLKINGIAGATEIGEGRIILILDPHELVRTLYSNKQEQESHA
jgi:two-component system chemotaxis sensor kinase CheA